MISSRARKRQSQNVSSYVTMAVKLSLFLVFLSSLFIIVAKFKTYFPIKSVKVYGIQHIDQIAMEHALLPLVNKGFFAIDVETIKDQLLQSPWVSTAVVQRIWPDKIFITIDEKKPIAKWNHSSLLSSNGEIFSPDLSSFSEELPQFIGQDGQHIQILNNFNKLNKLLKLLHFKIARLEQTPEASWSLTLNNGMKLSVDEKDILTRVNHFVKVYPKIIGNRYNDVDYVDLRYTNGLAVKWKIVS